MQILTVILVVDIIDTVSEYLRISFYVLAVLVNKLSLLIPVDVGIALHIHIVWQIQIARPPFCLTVTSVLSAPDTYWFSENIIASSPAPDANYFMLPSRNIRIASHNSHDFSFLF